MLTTHLAQLSETLSNYAEIPDELLVQFLPHLRPGQARKGEIIIHQGDFNDQIYLVTEGSVRAYHTIEGKAYTDWFALSGQFFSAISCFFQGLPSTHTYEALHKTEYMALPKTFVDEMANEHHAIERMVRNIVTESFLILQNRVVYHRFKSAKARYEELLISDPNLIANVPMKHIASYLGISPETLSRIRAEQT